MRMKKWLAAMLAAILVLNIALPANVLAEGEAEPKVVTKYVSEDGSNEYDGNTTETPYKTIEYAEQVLEADDTADIRKIVIMGTVEFSSYAHKKMMTITGEGQTEPKLSLNDEKNILGPTTIEHLTLLNNVDNKRALVTEGEQLVLGQGIKADAINAGNTKNVFFLIGKGNASVSTKPTFVMNSYDSDHFAMIQVGSTNLSNQIPGADITVHAGKVNQINLAWIAGGTTYTGDVNVVINGGFLEEGAIRAKYNSSVFEGAVQIVLNTGDANSSGKTIMDNTTIASNVNPAKGKWIMHGNTEGRLSTTETAGTFQVDCDKYAIVKSQDDSKTYYGAPRGTVTVPEPGDYTVTYSETKPEDFIINAVMYVSDENGNDVTGNGTRLNPYKSIAKAEEVLQSKEADTKKILIMGTVPFTAAAHDEMITISGEGQSSPQLRLDEAVNISGPTTIECLKLLNNYKGRALVTDGHRLVIGKQISATYTSAISDEQKNTFLLVGKEDGSVTTGRPTLEVNSFSVAPAVIQVGSNNKSNTIPGADITVNGGQVNQINLAWKENGTTYTEDVNVVINGGAVDTIQATESGTVFQKALQIVLNNGVGVSKVNANIETNASAAGGTWIMDGDNSGGMLSTTETAGTFNIIGSKYAIVTSKTDSTKKYYGAPGSTVTVPDAGKYTVTYVSEKPKAFIVETTKYVSAGGNDDTGDGTLEHPYASIQKAEEVIEADKGVDLGTIIVSGKVPFTAAPHTKMMTITGAGANAKARITLKSESISIAGPTTIDNTELVTPNHTEQDYNAGYLETGTDELIFGEGVITSYYNGYYRLGSDLSDAGARDGTGSTPTLTVNGLAHGNSQHSSNNIRIGTHDGAWMNGANLTINGGTIKEINIHRPTKFSKDVNIVINGGTIQTLTTTVNNDQLQGEYRFDKALQVVFNNGTYGDYFEKTEFDAIPSKSGSGKWYMYGDNSGGSLSTTETAGSFQVNGKKFVKATSKTEPSNIYYGAPGGILKVPEGEYVVTYLDARPAGYWELTLDGVSQGMISGSEAYTLPTPTKAGSQFEAWTDGTTDYTRITLTKDTALTSKWEYITETIYVSAKGHDDNAGTETDPMRSISAAITKLDQMDATYRKIVMLSDMKYTDAPHTNLIEIMGNNRSIVLTCEGKKLSDGDGGEKQGGTEIGGPTEFKNFTMAQDFWPVTNGHKVTFENIASKSTGNLAENGKLFVGTQNTDGSKGQKDDVEINNFGSRVAPVMMRIAGAENAKNDINLVLNSGYFLQVMFEGKNTFDGNVSITVNGGTYGGQFNQTVIPDEIGYQFEDYASTTTFNKALQVVINTGEGNKKVNEALRQVKATGGSWFMYDEVNETSDSDLRGALGPQKSVGLKLETTDTPGTFAVINPGSTTINDTTYTNWDPAYAVATNLQDPSIKYYSTGATKTKNGTLTVPEGEWVITYTNTRPQWYCTGSQVVFHQNTTGFDLAEITAQEYEDRIIVGWKNGENTATDGNYMEGTRLEAVYATRTKKANFYVQSTEIRLDDGALRFKLDVNRALYQELGAEECGIIAIEASEVPYTKCGDIKLDTPADTGKKTPQKIPAKNVYSYDKNTGVVTYSLCLTNIGGEAIDYYKDYMIRGYMIFKDKSGTQRVVYTDFEQTSVKATVEKMLSDDNVHENTKASLRNTKDYCKVIEQEKETLKKQYEGTSIPMNDGFSTKPLSVREIKVSKVNSDDAPLTLVQITDMHLNQLSEKDEINNRQTVRSFYSHREMGKNAAFAPAAERALRYADAVADQVIVTGDTLDNLNEGALDLQKRLIWSRYPNIISTPGNHDWVEDSVGNIRKTLNKEEAKQRLQEDARHDVLYSSKVMKNVMLIQMDNAAKNGYGYGYEASQIPMLRADLERAKANNYTVLIFQHVALPTDDDDPRFREIKITAGANASAAEKAVAACNAEMLQLIQDNSAIIKGIFCGHEHAQVDTKVGGIPQYVADGNYKIYGGEDAEDAHYGHVVKIVVQ